MITDFGINLKATCMKSKLEWSSLGWSFFGSSDIAERIGTLMPSGSADARSQHRGMCAGEPIAILIKKSVWGA